MGKTVCKCINKRRDARGNIVSYDLQLGNGQIINLQSTEVKKYVKSNKLEITNLQIDKAGRLVDKAVEKVQLQKTADNVDLEVMYSRLLVLAYKILQKGNMVKLGYVTYENEKVEMFERTMADYMKKLCGKTCYPGIEGVELAKRFRAALLSQGIYPNWFCLESKDSRFVMCAFCYGNINTTLEDCEDYDLSHYNVTGGNLNPADRSWKLDTCIDRKNPKMSRIGVVKADTSIHKLDQENYSGAAQKRRIATRNILDLLMNPKKILGIR